MKCDECKRSKGHTLGCRQLAKQLAAQRDELRVDQVLRVAKAAKMSPGDVVLMGAEFLSMADRVVVKHALPAVES